MNIVPVTTEEIKALEITSPAFKNKGYIPRKYTCDGEDINPPLDILHIPEETKSLVLMMIDHYKGKSYVHWLLWNVPPARKIKENTGSGIQGINDFGVRKYSGPCPYSGLHEYEFKIYALDVLLDQNPGLTKQDIDKKLAPYFLAFGKITGLYKR